MRKYCVLFFVVSLCFVMGCATAAKSIIQENDVIQAKINDVVAASTEMSSSTYKVVKGDCLWDISGHSNIYDDPFKWVLIYRSNRDAIVNPDIIEINQVLLIEKNQSDNAITQAVIQAKEWPPYKKGKGGK